MNVLNKNIIFYDGECGFCNRTVAFVLKHDKTNSIHFAPIESVFTKELFRDNDWPKPDLSTFYYFEKSHLHEKSKAALIVSRHFGFPFSFFQFFWIIPSFLRDWIYDSVAKHRKGILKGYCFVPNSEEKKLFID